MSHDVDNFRLCQPIATKNVPIFNRLHLSKRMDGEIKWRLPPLLWIPFVVFAGLLFVADVFQLKYYSMTSPMILEDISLSKVDTLRGFLVKTPGCRIPDMKAFDPSIQKFLQNLTQPSCNVGKVPLVYSNDTAIYVKNSSLAVYGIEDVELLSCCYTPFWRRKPKESEKDVQIKFHEHCVPFNDSVNITQEFIKVECSYDGKQLYKDFFAFVPKPNRSSSSVQYLNVLVIGLDAVSRLNLHRQLPETVEYLEKLSAVELLGYNKVGDNTFPNLIPVLTGLDENELVNTCWPSNTHRFDNCPFIWNDFKRKKYATAYAEDSAWMGIFNYVKRGFYEQPTDYFWSVFNMIAEKEIGNQHAMNVYRCVGGRQVYTTLLDYIKKFVSTMNNNFHPYFGFFWEVSVSHDYLNTPKWADGDFKRLFKFMNDSGGLEKTVLVFLSDHGIRWGGIRSTYQGRMEERLPFLYITIPKWYRETYTQAYANLRKNSRRLTTPFDLHETLKDLLDPFALTANYLEERYETENAKNISRGQSLFGTISSKRTCEDAGISPHWCTCQQTSPVDKTDKTVLAAANFTVAHINKLLKGYAQCANLTLDAIFDARLLTHSDHIAEGKDDNIVDYTITFRTQPGGGVFEVTVRRHKSAKKIKFEVTGTISRTNLYGKQSACVTDFHLKLYCYCKRLLKN